MGSVRLYGATSGYLELQAPDVSPDAALVLPSDSLQPGLVLVASETISGNSAINIDNCFTSDYDNYRLIVINSGASSADRINIRLRGSGTPVTSNYAGREVYVQTTTAQGSVANTDRWVTMVDYDTGPQSISGDILSPALAQRTMAMLTGNANGMYRTGSYTNTNATAYDGLTVYSENGNTWSGHVYIYGYRNS
jgi:hypothetical protein